MNGISTKVTASTLSFAVITILNWIVFDLVNAEPIPESVSQAITVLLVFAAGYLVPERAEQIDA